MNKQQVNNLPKEVTKHIRKHSSKQNEFDAFVNKLRIHGT